MGTIWVQYVPSFVKLGIFFCSVIKGLKWIFWRPDICIRRTESSSFKEFVSKWAQLQMQHDAVLKRRPVYSVTIGAFPSVLFELYSTSILYESKHRENILYYPSSCVCVCVCAVFCLLLDVNWQITALSKRRRPIPVASRSNGLVCSRLLSGTAG